VSCRAQGYWNARDGGNCCVGYRYLATPYCHCEVPTHRDICPQTCPHNKRQTKFSPPNFCFWLIIQFFYQNNKRLELILVVLNTYPQFYPQSALVSNFYPPWTYYCGYPHPRRSQLISWMLQLCVRRWRTCPNLYRLTFNSMSKTGWQSWGRKNFS
jgi:hypothetical protein